MPHLNNLVIGLWATGTVATVALAILSYFTGHFRRWPSLFTYLSLIAIKSVWCALSNHFQSPACYFYGFWSFQSLIDMSQVWIIVQIALRVAGVTPSLRRALVRGVPLFTLAAFVASLYVSLLDPIEQFERIVYVVQHVEVAIDLAICITATLLVWVTSGVGIQWSGGVRGVSSGILLEVLTSEISNSLVLRYPVATLNAIKSVSYLATMALWAVSLFRWQRASRQVQFPHSGVVQF